MNFKIGVFIIFAILQIAITQDAKKESLKRNGHKNVVFSGNATTLIGRDNKTLQQIEKVRLFDLKFYECFADCFKSLEFPSKFYDLVQNTSEDVFRAENSTNIGRLFDVELFEWFCEFAKNRTSCVSACPESRFKTFFFQVTEPTAYSCTESDFLSHVKCYKKVYQADVNGCDRDEMCGAYKFSAYYKVMENVNLINSSQDELINNQTSFLISNFTQNLCEYIACGNRCRRDELIKECGSSEANDTLMQLYRKLIRQIKTVVNFFTNFIDEDPIVFTDQCDVTLKT